MKSNGLHEASSALATLAALFLVSCSEDTVRPEEIPSPTNPSWTWLNPLPQGNTLLAVWGSSPCDVYAVGERGAIVHFDGAEWTATESGTRQRLWGVMGSSSKYIWAVGGGGRVLFNDGSGWTKKEIGTAKTLTSVWVTGDGTVYACSADGLVLKNDGWSWSVLCAGGSVSDHGSVWADENGEVFFAGYHESLDDQAFFGAQLWVMHYAGASWTSKSYLVGSGSLRAVWGSSSQDVYFVGWGTAIHYNGVEYNELWIGSRDLLDIWGVAANDIFAVGANGLILRYDGAAWNPMTSGTGSSLYGVWGSSGSDVYAVGDGGLIQHFDGAWWTTSAGHAATRLNVNDLWGLSAADVYAVGASGLILHYDGSACARIDGGTSKHLNGVWASSPADIWAVGEDGTIVHGSASLFGAVASPTGLNLCDVHGTSSTDVYAAAGEASAGQVLHYDGAAWSVAFETTTPLNSVWAVSPTEVYAIGAGIVCSFDGSAWSEDRGYGYIQRRLWARGPDDVYALGIAGVYHYDGVTWSQPAPPQPRLQYNQPLTGLWGCGEDIYTVGPGYGVFHCDGSSWEILESPSIRLTAVWGSGPDDIIFAGTGGDIIRYRRPE